MLTVLAAASPADAARAARLLFMYWKSRGAYGEIRQRFTTVLEHPDVTDRARAELFGLLSDAELMVGDLDASEAAARQSLSLAEPGSAVRTYALLGLTIVSGERGEPEEAVRLGREVLEEIDAFDDRRRIITRMDVASVFRDAGLREEARTMYAQVSDEARRRGDLPVIAVANSNACWLDLLEQRYDAAAAGFRPFVDIARGLGNAPWEADGLRGLGVAMLGLGKRAEARTALTSSLDLLASDPTPGRELTATLLWIALATEAGDVRSAARLAGAIAAIRSNARLTGWFGEVELRRPFEQPLIDALGEDDWAREQAAGATLTLEEVIALALRLAAPQSEATPHSA
jgi:tetratricopeptide (TPR) repeat protein